MVDITVEEEEEEEEKEENWSRRSVWEKRL